MNKEIMLGVLNPAGLPALRIAGALFLAINLLAGVWLWRHRRQLFGPDSAAPGDRPAVRYLQVVALSVPWLFLTFRLFSIWVETWVN